MVVDGCPAFRQIQRRRGSGVLRRDREGFFYRGTNLYSAASFEELDFPLVLDGGGSRGESSQIAPFSRFRIFLTGIEAVFSGGEFSDHGSSFFTRYRIRLPLSRLAERIMNRLRAKRAGRMDRIEKESGCLYSL